MSFCHQSRPQGVCRRRSVSQSVCLSVMLVSQSVSQSFSQLVCMSVCHVCQSVSHSVIYLAIWN